jgi:septum site-determining protein MinC
VTETSSHHIRFRGRSFPVLALEPESPLAEWMERLDAHLGRTPAFFRDKSIVVDVTGLGLARSGVVSLIGDLSKRGIRIMGLTGVEPNWASADLPPILMGGRNIPRAVPGTPEGAKADNDGASGRVAPSESARANGAANGQGAAKIEALEPTKFAPLIVNSPVRSGQLISNPAGDVTVIGSVASGAEVIAGGSVHVYGALRGRAMAGAHGETHARIFCRRLEAELLAVCGFYITADEIEVNVRGQAVQAWLEGETVKVARLD